MDQPLSSTVHARRAATGEEGFSFRRLALVAGLDLQESLRRPLFLIWAAFMVWNGWLMSRSEWIYHSIDTSLGGPKAWADSEFQITYVFALAGFFFLAFFVAVASGTPLVRDEELNVGPLLHSTPLRAGEYVWGKFLAALLACLGAMAVMPVATGVFSRLLPDLAHPEFYGPFHLVSYVRPTLVFLVPAVVFTAGAAFALGRFTGRPIVVFLLPISLFLFLTNFFWRWYPPTLNPSVSAVLRLVDPSGFRWLKESWLFTDRGLAFYNTRPVGFDAPFLLSRVAFVLAGLLLVDLSHRHFAGRLRRTRTVRKGTAPETAAATARPVPTAVRGVTVRPPSFFRGTLAVARFELAELRSQPGLYILVPVVLLFMYILYTGGYDNQFDPVLLTPGTAAVDGLLALTTWLVLLFLFYTVESLERERTTGLGPVFFSTPVRTSSLVTGKVLALGVVGLLAVAAGVLTAGYSIVRQGGEVAMDLRPFLLVWGLLLPPTLILWTAFVAAVLVATRSRYATYGIGLGAIVLTVFVLTRNHMSWAGNWPLIGAGRGGSALIWSDLGAFDLDRTALLLNRLLVLAAAVPLAWAAVRFFPRRERDRMRPALAPAERRRTLLTATALIVVPLALGLALWGQVSQGFQGGAVEEKHKEYWRKNHATWLNQPQPYITHVDMDVDFDPAGRAFQVAGAYDLQNRKEKALDWFAVSGGTAWKGLAWTVDGRPWRPEDRDGLYVFRLPRPLAPGQGLKLGFRYRGTILAGISKNGGDVPLGEFVLPSGVILTGRNPDFVPVIGYVERIGVDDKNRYEARIYPPRFYEGITDSSIDRSAFTQKLRITAPAEYTVNSTGVLTGETVKDGRRTVVWESDYPVRVFNVAASRGWAVKRGNGTAVFYHPGHPWNVPSLLEALNGARRYYAEWFGPYPWRELRLNEFPALATYARGNATNIFFSEGAGFLSQRTPAVDPAFAVAAHESAHQWWGHILAPGEGPGGIVLAEGAANFSTLMLLEQMRGFQPRMSYARQMEANYGERRQPSTELPLAGTLSVDGRPGDETVVYDKGGWVLWMLRHQMGHDRFVAGARSFITTWHQSQDHPVIEDFVAAMRPYAADKPAFDEFVQQWFFDKVIPEYHLDDLRKRPLGAGEWEVTVKVENAGTGRMPVEVAATRGDRFDDKGGIDPGYHESRTTVMLGAGEAKEVRIRCTFEPQRVEVDPDGYVMQLQRRAASAKL
ncbi:MAG: type transport system permease protein [Acidobacteriota bacterium]|jgi:ABC-type transport system involved in multi-copper enzyme maturation permease subunit|nr:type transport system permease protein [Acidobacteriota bacterium]